MLICKPQVYIYAETHSPDYSGNPFAFFSHMKKQKIATESGIKLLKYLFNQNETINILP